MSEQNTTFFRFTILVGMAFLFAVLIIWSDIATNEISSWDFYGAIFAFLLFAGSFLLYAFYALRRARLIEDTPTARIRSAHQGFVELEGRAKPLPGQKLIAPLTKRECCWYSYSIADERKTSRGKSLSEQGDSYAIPFLLEDDTGTCLIDPREAEILTEHEKQWCTNNSSPYPELETSRKKVLKGITFRFKESVLLEGDIIYVVGDFQTLDDAMRTRKQAEFGREILKGWKADQQALLGRFDENRDGKINQAEWGKARDSAVGLAAQRIDEMMRRFPHRLSCPKNKVRGQKFIISNRPQSELAYDFGQRAKVSLCFTIYNFLLTFALLARYDF